MQKQNLKPVRLGVEKLTPGDILLFPPNTIKNGGWVGQAIIYFTKGTVSHTAIYVGNVNGDHTVAHAVPNGIILQSLDELIASEPDCYVRRRMGGFDLTSVLEEVKKHTDVEEPYPFANLGILGLLILLNKFSKKTFKDRIVYDFALLVGVKLMKIIQENTHSGTTPMTCSQFAAQCYTDAGSDYDIKFDKLLLQFGNIPSNTKTTSLFDMLKSDEKIDSDLKPHDSILMRERDIVNAFFDLVNGQNPQNSKGHVTSEEFHRLAGFLLYSSCLAITGQKPKLVKDATGIFSTNRNYLVTPDDLLSNASNLNTEGYMKGR